MRFWLTYTPSLPADTLLQSYLKNAPNVSDRKLTGNHGNEATSRTCTLIQEINA